MTTSDVDRARRLIDESLPFATTQLIPISGRTTGGYLLKIAYLDQRVIFEEFTDLCGWVADQILRCDLSQGLVS